MRHYLPKLAPQPLLLLVLAVVLLLPACAKKRIVSPQRKPATVHSQQKSPKGYVKPRTYTVMGQTYRTIASAHGFEEVGYASWYGKDFHGRPTANGEKYDMYGMTAAHKLLPFNTKVRVTNLENGKSIVVRINDRGPFVKSRIIDLTYTGAEKIGMIGPGTAKVRVESLSEVPHTPKGELAGRFFIQVGAFGKQANAQKLCNKLRSEGYGCREHYMNTRNLWRVQVGPYATLPKAEKAREAFLSMNDKSFIFAD